VRDLANWFELLSLSFQFVAYAAEKPASTTDSPYLSFRTIAPWQTELLQPTPATNTFTTSGRRAGAVERRVPQQLMERTRSDFVLISPEGATLDYVTWRATLTRLWYDWSATKPSQLLPESDLSSEQEQPRGSEATVS
jgi:hypothetical protein